MTTALYRSSNGSPQVEQFVICEDPGSGLQAAISIDDTTLGPGLGGVRWRPYPTFPDAMEEARRLSRVMTLKNALADIPYGGAKSVIIKEPGIDSEPERRHAQLMAYAGFVRDLGGRYIPGVDMGTSVDDLAMIATVAPWVSCSNADPSPSTALGVFHSMVAAVRQLLGHDVAGVRVVVQGAGHVGSSLAGLLSTHGAEVLVADVDTSRAAAVAAKVGGAVLTPASVHTEPCDVFAPCASARVLSPKSIAELNCTMVVGAANDVLAQRSCADILEGRGILYVPDFLSNAGGVIAIHAERAGWDDATLTAALEEIGPRTTRLLNASVHSTPLQVAEEWASERLGRTVTVPD
jgi:leucine dehydrogenase